MAEPIADDDPTTHELERKASVAAWEDVRESFLHVFTESFAMKIGQECLNCKKEAGLRCLGCGPAAFFCEDCFSDLHMVVNIFHVPERWQVPTFCLSHGSYTLSY